MTENLSQFIESIMPETHLRVEQELGDGFVLLRREEAERRQAAQDIRCSEDMLMEMLRNSRDAGATRIYVATWVEAGVRTIVIADNGCGIPESMTELVFSPRVTSKLDSVHMDKWGIHGRGMALYSIRENCLEAKVSASTPGLGTAIVTRSSLATLSEKSDQSTFPQFRLEEQGKVKISGPKNLLRVTAEFALEHRNQIAVYLGSATEIAATLLDNGVKTYSLAELSLLPDTTTVPLVDLPAFAHSPAQLQKDLNRLGLSLSERSCRRVFEGEIDPLSPMHQLVRDALSASVSPEPKKPVRSARAPVPAIVPGKDDLSEFSGDVMADYKKLAEKYYLDAKAQPSLRVRGGNLIISIPLLPEER